MAKRMKAGPLDESLIIQSFKDADLLAGNRVNSGDSGFGAATNSMAVVDRTGHEEIWPNQSKADVAWDLCSWLLRL